MTLEQLYTEYGKVCVDFQIIQSQKSQLEQVIVAERNKLNQPKVETPIA